MKTLSEEYEDYIFIFAHKDETLIDIINKGVTVKNTNKMVKI